MLKVWPRYAGYGAAAGVVTASAMMCWKMKSIDADGVEDRCVSLEAIFSCSHRFA